MPIATLVSALFSFSSGTSGTTVNPFLNPPGGYYVQPSYAKEVNQSIATAKGVTELNNLKRMAATPTAFWIDRKSKLHGSSTDTVEGVLADAARMTPAPLTVFVLYNLPNRDCDSTNSVGEICCYYFSNGTCDRAQGGDCAAGLSNYTDNFVDPFAALLAKYEGIVPTAVIVEPDSLPNLATNLGNPHCANSATGKAYTTGIPYAINKIAAVAPSAALYLDAAHGGWLGWDDNAQAYVSLIVGLSIEQKLRGMATNVANYQPVGYPCPSSAFDQKMHVYCQGATGDICCQDPCNLIAQWSSGNNEYNYIQSLTKELKRAMPYWSPHFIIDTSRNGIVNERSSCSNFCNPRGAGVGHYPTSSTALPDLVDALFWIKTPGESDGCTHVLPDSTICPRYDPMCESSDSIGSDPTEPRAPEAGDWFDYQVKQLAQNALFNSTIAQVPQPVTVTQLGAFQPCKLGQQDPCAQGYRCTKAHGSHSSRCLPTVETSARFGHNSLFSTMEKHASEIA